MDSPTWPIRLSEMDWSSHQNSGPGAVFAGTPAANEVRSALTTLTYLVMKVRPPHRDRSLSPPQGATGVRHVSPSLRDIGRTRHGAPGTMFNLTSTVFCQFRDRLRRKSFVCNKSCG